MTDSGPINRSSAVDDYYKARRQAAIHDILARLTGKPLDLLPFDEVRRKLRGHVVIERGVQDIPLDAIIGSVNRYQDFSRRFFPRKTITRDRWAGVELAAAKKGLPPIEVYQIGEAFFVKDGNHRVSAARHLGWTHIQAYVEEVLTRVPLTPDVTPDELILKAEYVDFLERTRLPEILPQAGVELTAPGQYPRLLEHIAAHRDPVDSDREGVISDKAVANWFDLVYQPIAQIIAETGILRDFPGRTITDLYLWTVEHRLALEHEFGQEIRPEAAARHLAVRFSPRPRRLASRLGSKIGKFAIPKKFQVGPPVGMWREERLAAPGGVPSTRRLFSDILVAVSGKPEGWSALQQALEIAQREGAGLHGLHVFKSEEMRETEEAQAIEVEFNRRCAQAGVSGKIAFGVGSVTGRIWEQSRWNDLVVVNLTYPPLPQPFAALGAGFRSLVQRCSRPLLAVPRRVSPLSRALLAYDGSPKAHEALYVAAYLAGRWKLDLVVITVFENVPEETLADAWQYLESHEISATYMKGTGPAIQEILITSEEHGCDLLIMGGHSHQRAFDAVLGNTVDQVLREAHKPVLICR